MSAVTARGTLPLEIHAQPLLGGGSLVSDYLAGHDLAAFFSGHPGDVAAYARKAAEVDARLGAAERAWAQASIEPLGDAAARLARILGGDGYFVTTGQQPALFGGPLYTLYKALGTIRLAQTLERRLDRPVLALFWIGADDHDWDEASHSAIMDEQDYPRRIAVRAPPDVPPLPLSERTWGTDVLRAVSEFVTLLPAGEARDAVAAHVRSVYTPETTVAASFRETMRFLLRDRRIALVDSSDHRLRRAALPVLRAEAMHTAAHIARIQRQTQRLETLGYRAQVTVSTDASNLMLLDAQGRDRLLRTARGWLTRRERQGIDEASLLQRLEDQPQRFSPNVLLRPVVESAVFPTIAYVGGPGELSYFAQIGCLFTAHGILPPIVVPRPSVTIVEPKVRALVERLGLAPDDFRRPLDVLVAELARRELPEPVHGALLKLRDALYRAYGEVADTAAELDPTLAHRVDAARNRALLEAHTLEKRFAARMKRRNAVVFERLRRAAAHLSPDGAPQERVLGPLPFIARYGTALVPQLEAAIPMDLTPVASWAGPSCD